jgi:hypothetical protein
VGGALAQPGPGVGQLGLHRADLQPVRLLGVGPAEPGRHLGQVVQVLGQAGGQVQGDPAQSPGHRQLVDQRVHRPLGGLDAVLVLDQQHVPGDHRSDERIAVPVAADPRAEGQRAGRRCGLHAQPAQRIGEVVEHPRGGVGVQVGEVVDGVAGLIGRVRPIQPQLVGLPEQVDQLGEPAGGRGGVGGAVQHVVGRLGVQRVGQLAQLGQDRPAGRLGGMRGEHRPDGEPAGGGGYLVGRYPLLGDPLGRLVQPAAVAGPAPAQVAGAVHLLGDVGQVEVRGEGAGQLGAGGDVHRGQPVGGRPGVLADQRADLLDQVEQRRALLAGEGLAEQLADPPDVRAKGGVRAAFSTVKGGGGVVGRALGVDLAG